MTLFDVAGKVVLVTGGATGIGRMIAGGFVAAGATVLIASRKGEACVAAAQALTAEGPGRAEGFAADVASEAGAAGLAAEVERRAGRLDVLVNNAGVAWGAPLESFPRAQWARVMETNVAGPFGCIQALLPMLRKAATPQDPARIVNIGSVMGTIASAEGNYSYVASKAAIHHLTRVLAAELAPRAITVNALAPGLFPSKMTRFAVGTAEGAAEAAGNIPLGRLGAAGDAAGAAIFLASRAGAYVTGAVLPLDGGVSVGGAITLFPAQTP